MKKEKKATEKKDAKTAFSMREYDRAIIDMEFVSAAMDVVLEIEEPCIAFPLLYEAVSRAINHLNLLKSMRPAAEVTP